MSELDLDVSVHRSFNEKSKLQNVIYSAILYTPVDTVTINGLSVKKH